MHLLSYWVRSATSIFGSKVAAFDDVHLQDQRLLAARCSISAGSTTRTGPSTGVRSKRSILSLVSVFGLQAADTVRQRYVDHGAGVQSRRESDLHKESGSTAAVSRGKSSTGGGVL